MEAEKKQPAAVYVSWGTFKNGIEGLAQATPNRIDKTVYPGLNPAVASQLLAAYKFLGLTDDTGKPTAVLQALAVRDEEERKKQLDGLIRQRYADLFALNLEKTTPAELAERMEKSYGVSGDTKDKAIRFFLGAVTYIGIPVSVLLKKAGNGGAKKRNPRKQKPQPPPLIPDPPRADSGNGSSRVITLKSGGTLTLSASLNFLALSPADRKFFSELIDQLDKYEGAVSQ